MALFSELGPVESSKFDLKPKMIRMDFLLLLREQKSVPPIFPAGTRNSKDGQKNESDNGIIHERLAG